MCNWLGNWSEQKQGNEGDQGPANAACKQDLEPRRFIATRRVFCFHAVATLNAEAPQLTPVQLMVFQLHSVGKTVHIQLEPNLEFWIFDLFPQASARWSHTLSHDAKQ